VFFALSLAALGLPPTVSLVKSVLLQTDNDSDGKADPGDTLRYSVTVTNPTASDLTNLTFTDQLDPNLSLVANSLKTSPVGVDDAYAVTGNVKIDVPAGNGLLTNDINLDSGDSLQVTAVDTTGTHGNVTFNGDGSFTFDPEANFNGTTTFTYTVTDNQSLTGTGMVTLTVSDRIIFVDGSVAGPGSGRMSDPYNTLASAAGVSALASGKDVIYLYGPGIYTGGITLKNNQALIGQGVTLSTALADPSINLPLANYSVALPAAGIAPTITNSGGSGVTLGSTNQVMGVMIGDCASTALTGTSFGTLTVSSASISNSTSTALSLTTGTINATFSSVSASVGGNLNNVAGSLTANGGTISGGTGTDFNVMGGSVNVTWSGAITQSSNNPLLNVTGGHTGTLTFQTGTLNASSGTGLQFNNADGTYNFNGTTILNGGDAGIDVTNGSSGTFSFGSGVSITNPTGHGLYVAGSAPNLTYAGTIDYSGTTNQPVLFETNTGGTVTVSGSVSSGVTINNTGRGILVQNNTGGSFNFSGSQTLNTASRNAVTLANNTGATVNFTGGSLHITTTSGSGFTATGGGTLNVTGSSNTLATTTGTALNVSNTTVGASSMTFRSISANGAANGIALNNTGSNNALTVSGNSAVGTGGTITNITGSDGSSSGIGVYLNNTRGVSLNWMNLSNCNNFAIYGNTVTNATLNRLAITGTNGNSDIYAEGSVAFDNLFGTASVTNTSVSGGYTDSFRITNTSGSLNPLTFDTVTLGANDTNAGNDGITLDVSGSGSIMNAVVKNSTFTSARGDLFQMNLSDSADCDLSFHDNMLSNDHTNKLSGGIVLSDGNSSGDHLTYTIDNNTFQGAKTSAIVVSKGVGSGTIEGTISNNTLGVSGASNSGSTDGSGIEVDILGQGTNTAKITGNQIYQYNVEGIQLYEGGASSSVTGVTNNGVLNATVTNNTVSNPGGGGNIDGVRLTAGTHSGDAYQVCLDLGGSATNPNTISGSEAGSGFEYRLDQTQSTTVKLPGYTGANNSNASVKSYIEGRNSTGANGSVSNTVSTGGGGFVNTAGGAACPQPGSPSVSFFRLHGSGDYLARGFGGEGSPTLRTPLTVTKLDTASSVLERPLTPAFGHLSPLGREAGDGRLSLRNLASNDFVMAHTLTPFCANGIRSQKLSALTSLPRGERWPKVGVRGLAARRSKSEINERTRTVRRQKSRFVCAAGVVTVGIPSLPAGKSITVVFDAQVNSTVGSLHISNQAHVTGAAITDSDSNTVTTDLDGSTTTTVAASANPSKFGEGVSFTATITPTSTGADPTGSVQFKMDGGDFGSPVAVASGTATSDSISSLSVGDHSITAFYTATGGFTDSDNSASPLTQTVEAADTQTVVTQITPAGNTATTYGDGVTFRATVSAVSPGAGLPGGTIEFAQNGNPISATVTYGSSGGNLTGDITVSDLPAGDIGITARYLDTSGNFNSSAYSSAFIHHVNAGTVTVAVTSSKNPSNLGDSVTFTATVTPTSGSIIPAGSVTFHINGNPFNNGTVNLDANGIATITIPNGDNAQIGVGNWTIRADYNGDAGYAALAPGGTLPGGQTVVNPIHAGQVLISEFRARGPQGESDEYIELYNNTDTNLTVLSTDGSSGWSLAASDGAIRATLPNGFVFPARSHYLVANGNGYSLGSVTPEDDDFFTDLPTSNLGLALFSTSNAGNFSLANRLDAVGYQDEPTGLYREGTGFSTGNAEMTQDLEYAFVRNLASGEPADTDNNLADFVVVQTVPDALHPTALGSKLGAPGPESSGSPITHNEASYLRVGLFDPGSSSSASPNRDRDVNDTGTNKTFGTLSINRTIENTSGLTLNSVKLRVVSLSTAPQVTGRADLRVLGVKVQRSQPWVVWSDPSVTLDPVDAPFDPSLGGGLNSTLTVVDTDTPMLPGDVIAISIVLGVETPGSFKFAANFEALL
jgi:hypothetical protein